MGLFSSITKTITKPISDITKIITKPFSSVTKDLGTFLMGRPTELKGYAQSPEQAYAEDVIRDIIENDKTADKLKGLSEKQYKQLVQRINRLPRQIDREANKYKGISKSLLNQIYAIDDRIASTYDDTISKYETAMRSSLNKKNRALSVLGLLNTPMTDYTMGDVINQYMLPLYQQKSSALSEAYFRMPTMAQDVYKTFQLPFSQAKIQAYANQPAQLIQANDWYAKMQMLPIETQRALIGSLLGTSGQPIIQNSTAGVGQALIQGGAMALFGG